MSDILDKHLVFQFKFVHKTKKVHDSFIEKLKIVSQYTIRNLQLSSKQQAGFATIETNKTKLPQILAADFINYIKQEHDKQLEQKIVKYEYLRVGNKERIFDKLLDNIFYIIIYDPDKKMITN